MSQTFDAVVVGSGAGGAPLACRLAEAGWKVLLLERGRAWQRDEFDRDEIEWCRRDRFVPSPRTDPHTRRHDEGQRATPTTDGWISTVLGGGTVHMGAYFLRAHEDDAKQATRCGADGGHTALDWAVPFADVARFYPLVEKELGVSGAPGWEANSGMPPLAAHALAAKVDAAAEKLGMTSLPTPRGILTAARPDEDRLACAYRQLCASYGCPNDARASMAATYLRRAGKTNNLTVWTESLATKVLAGENNRARGVEVVSRTTGARQEVTSKVVVVAGGAIESARLLLLSGPSFNPQGQVGKNLWFSLFVEVSGVFDKGAHDDVTDLMAGSPFLNRTVNWGTRLKKDVAAQAGVDRTGMFEVAFVHDNPIHRAERVATESGRLLWGSGLKAALSKSFRDGRTVILEGFGESLPHAGSYVDLDPTFKDRHGLPAARITHWHHPRDTKVAQQMAKDGSALLHAMRASDVRVTRAMSETLVLQGGTCRFGADPKNSVTDPDGALHGMKNVYVSDGGALPSSLAAPATLSILANSLRIADRIIARER